MAGADVPSGRCTNGTGALVDDGGGGDCGLVLLRVRIGAVTAMESGAVDGAEAATAGAALKEPSPVLTASETVRLG